MCFGVQKDTSIRIERIVMMPMRERKLNLPGTIEVLFHRIRIRVPVIEIPDERHRRGSRRNANEVGRAHRFQCCQTLVRISERIAGMHIC